MLVLTLALLCLSCSFSDFAASELFGYGGGLIGEREVEGEGGREVGEVAVEGEDDGAWDMMDFMKVISNSKRLLTVTLPTTVQGHRH